LIKSFFSTHNEEVIVVYLGAACVTKSFQIHPEIIIISDGRATDLSVDIEPLESDPMSDWEVSSLYIYLIC